MIILKIAAITVIVLIILFVLTLIIYFFTQKYIIQGVGKTGVKG